MWLKNCFYYEHKEIELQDEYGRTFTISKHSHFGKVEVHIIQPDNDCLLILSEQQARKLIREINGLLNE